MAGSGPRSAAGGPLSHIRVLDLTEFLAGPFGTQILGDLGAEVIKIESARGDSSRHVPPHYINGISTYFYGISRNKRSVVVDLKTPEGLQLIKDLAAKSDVLFENRRPGVLERLGIDYDELSKTNPGLVWCSVSGFGQDGPDRDRPAYDMIVQALSGGMSLTGERGGKPVRAGIPIGDVTAGMYGVIGTLAALARRAETGEGDYIDVAMLDVQIALLTYQASAYLHSGKVVGPQGREHESIATYRCFAARDGIDVAITANTERMWVSLCEVLDEKWLVDDPRFASDTTRLEHKDELVEILNAAFLKRDADEWVTLLREAAVPVASVNTVDRALAEPQVRHRGMVLELVGDEPAKRARVAGNPIKIKKSARSEARFPPSLGGDTREVLSGILGYSADKIEELLAKEIVAAYGEVDEAAE